MRDKRRYDGIQKGLMGVLIRCWIPKVRRDTAAKGETALNRMNGQILKSSHDQGSVRLSGIRRPDGNQLLGQTDDGSTYTHWIKKASH